MFTYTFYQHHFIYKRLCN